jgi:hypothetical protein
MVKGSRISGNESAKSRFSVLLGIVAVLISFPSCVWLNWQAPPPTSDHLADSLKMNGRSTIYFNLPDYFNASSSFQTQNPWLYRLTSDQLARGIQEGLKASGAEEAIMITKPPDSGVFCSITLARKDDRSIVTKAYWYFTSLTLRAIPYYGDLSTYVVTYELYIDGKPKSQYHYQIEEKEFSWLGALLIRPFMSNDWIAVTGGRGLSPQQLPWLNRFATTIGATANSFLADAQRDRFL